MEKKRVRKNDGQECGGGGGGGDYRPKNEKQNSKTYDKQTHNTAQKDW